MLRNKKILSHSEELKLKKELEALGKEAQHDFLQKKQLLKTPHTTTCTLAKQPDSVCTLESLELTEEAQEKPCGKSGLAQNSTSLMSAGSVISLHTDPLISPSAFLPESALKPDIKMHSELSTSHRLAHIKGICEKRNAINAIESVHMVLCPQGQKSAPKPAIAQLAGTAKVVSMSVRPQPPSKPRSERPAAGTRTFTHKSTNESEQVSPSENKEAERRNQRSNVHGRPLTSESTDKNREDLGSGQSHESIPRKVKRKKRGERKDGFTETGRTSTDVKSSKSQRSIVVPGHVRIVKSTSELLDEAQNIVGAVGAEAPEERDPEQSEPMAMCFGGAGGGMVDEIIASVQRRYSDVPPTSDQLMTEVMMPILEESYNADNKEEKKEASKSDTSKKKEVIRQKSPLPQRTMLVKKETPDSPRPVEHPKVTSGLYKMTHSADSESMASGFPQKVADTDVMTAQGVAISPAERPKRLSLQNKTIQDLSLLATWTPKAHAHDHKTIHHLCTAPVSQALPLELQLASRVCHTFSFLTAPPQFHQQRAALQHIAAQSDRHSIVNEGVPCVELTSGNDCVTHLPPQTRDSLADWQRIAEYYVEKPRILLSGQASSLCSSELKMFWHPAPPKFSWSPTFIKHKLFPKYQGTQNRLSREELHGDERDLLESACKPTEMETTNLVESVLSRKFQSMVDLKENKQSPQPSMEKGHLKRPVSAPHLHPEPDAFQKVPCDFTAITKELEAVRQQLSFTQATPTIQFEAHQHHNAPLAVRTAEQLTPVFSYGQLQPKKDRCRVLLGQALRRGRVSHSRKRASKDRKKLSRAELAYVREKLQEPPRALTRSESVCQRLPINLPTEKPRPPLPRCPSLPLVLDFEGFAADRGGIPHTLPPREWVTDIWDSWFDGLFLPEKSSSAAKKVLEFSDKVPGGVQNWAPEGQRKPREKDFTLDEILALDSVDLSLNLDQGLTAKDLEGEVAKLNQAIAQQDNPSAFDLCRRGALQKKMGWLHKALEDLNASIALEPYLLDAYWHRHSIYLLRKDQSSALDDLNFIIKHNKKHADAFKSKAEMYRLRGHTILAVINYTQAIKCRPEDDDSYFRRAQMYEKRGEVILAMEDYAKTFSINPQRTDALIIHGLHYFNNSNWTLALADFTLLLQHQPGNHIGSVHREEEALKYVS